LFRRFWDECGRRRFVVLAVEWTVFNEDSRVVGTLDALVFDLTTGEVVIIDWKTSSTADRRFARRMKTPLEHMADTKLNRNFLQLNVYRRVLMCKYSIIVDRMCIFVFDVTVDDWAEYAVPVLQTEVDNMVQAPRVVRPPPAPLRPPDAALMPTHVRARSEGLPDGVRYDESKGSPVRPWDYYTGITRRTSGDVHLVGEYLYCRVDAMADGRRRPCREAEELDVVRAIVLPRMR
jgi:hypothetical protein